MIFDHFTLGAFYHVLGNLHSKFRQCLSMIQLLGLVKSTFIKEYGMECILKHLLNDFHKLEIVCYKNITFFIII